LLDIKVAEEGFGATVVGAVYDHHTDGGNGENGYE